MPGKKAHLNIEVQRNFYRRGLHFGFCFGLLATLCDSFYLRIPDTFVPASYPLLIFAFNTLFWSTFGLLGGVFFERFVKQRQKTLLASERAWLLFVIWMYYKLKEKN